VPQLIGGWQHNYSTKARQAGHVNEQSIYSLFCGLREIEKTVNVTGSCNFLPHCNFWVPPTKVEMSD